MKASVGLVEMIKERMEILREWAEQLVASIADKEKSLENAKKTLEEYKVEYTELQDFLKEHSDIAKCPVSDGSEPVK